MEQKFLKLPTEFCFNRIFVCPITFSGEQLKFYTDTGGGAMIIEPEIVQKLNLPIFKSQMEDGEERNFIKFPKFKDEASIPMGNTSDELLVMSGIPWGQGLLGQSWFADKVWYIDYPKNEMGYTDANTNYNTEGYYSTPIGFKEESNGKRPVSFPRVQAKIDDELINFLFDTGATVHLTDEAIKDLENGEEKFQGTSFITQSVFDRWREKHPEWLVINNADQFGNNPMIQVPSVEIAGLKSGSVWFTARPDSNFHDYMSQVMDVQVEGALGGSVFKYYSIIIDYPNSLAYFKM